jgi:hypothetical protein
MMRRAFYNPLNLSKEMKWLSGAACFAEIARCVGSWNAKAIEDRVKNGAISIEREDPDNGVRRLLRGEMPSDRTIERLLAVYPDLEIARWRDHGLWLMLEAATPSIPRILHALGTLDDVTRDMVVAKPACASGGETFYVRQIDAAAIGALEMHGGIDGLLALAAIVRHSDASATFHARPLAAAASLRVFPRIVGASPHLFVSWPVLLKRFVDNIWRRNLDGAPSPRVLKSTIEQLLEISAAARRAGACLAPDTIVAKSLHAIVEECAGNAREDIENIVATASLLAG